MRHHIIEFTGQYKWHGLFSAVHSCSFLVCTTDIYIYFYSMFYVSAKLPIKSSIVLRYSMNKLTYLLTEDPSPTP